MPLLRIFDAARERERVKYSAHEVESRQGSQAAEAAGKGRCTIRRDVVRAATGQVRSATKICYGKSCEAIADMTFNEPDA